jgi:transcription elongation factor GreA
MASHHLSRSAFERLKEEHYDLTTRGRIEVANKIEAARLLGDLSENGDYHAAKDEQGHMEGRIRQLEHLIENAEIIDSGDDGVAGPGSVVTVMFDGDSPDDAEQYLLGHPEETPPAGASIMTLNSPLGAALVGATEGEWVEYTAPNGNTLRVQVLKVELA